jgi:carbamoyl-phosphate synthase small subunit
VKKGLLITADGSVFTGVAAGAGGVATGEVVFNTAMTGYQEIVTDPSYAGQVVVLTAPHIGNYGSSGVDDQAEKIHAKALVTRSMSRTASSWRSEEPFRDYLTRRGIVALSEVDTRRLTRHIRDLGAMPVAVGSDIDEGELASIAAAAPTMAGLDLVQTVTTDQAYVSKPEPDSDPVAHVVAYDFGIKRDILRQLNRRGVAVTVVPASTSAREVLAMDPDAVFLSNGPGDPEPLDASIRSVKDLLGQTPIFGICLGHQVLGLALGAKTFKLPFGHHGGNHPVRNVDDGTVDITSQNHGFAVDLWSLAGAERPKVNGLPGPEMLAPVAETAFGSVRQTHQNLNDGTNEGLACLDVDAFSVQYHPEAAPGPNDARKLFDRFVESIGPPRA